VLNHYVFFCLLSLAQKTAEQADYRLYKDQYFKEGASLKKTMKTLLPEDDTYSRSRQRIKLYAFFLYNLLILSVNNIYNYFAFFFWLSSNRYRWNSLKNFKRPLVVMQLESTQWNWTENIRSSKLNESSQNLDRLRNTYYLGIFKII